MSTQNSCEFCPFCQMPLYLVKSQNLNLHIEVCSRKKKPIKECPKGIDCNSSMICHYERYSHLQLAKDRANIKNFAAPILISTESRKICVETPGYSSEDFVPAALGKRQKLNRSFSKRVQRRKYAPTQNSESKHCKISQASPSSTSDVNDNSLINSVNDVIECNDDIVLIPDNLTSLISNQNKCEVETKSKLSPATIPSQNCKTNTGCNLANNSNEKTEYKQSKIINNQPTATLDKKQKQGDIGAMLFGFKPKLKEDTQIKKENYKPHNFTPSNKKSCPFYKKVDGTDIAVDAFSYGIIPGINHYFLSHFHYDHYMGLTKKFQADIYCSDITGNLVQTRLKILDSRIKRLPMNEKISVGNISVTLFEANHCPGAVLFLFQLKNGRVILHTGDFRADDILNQNIKAIDLKVDILYLDTTYLDPAYSFPPQESVVKYVSDNVNKIVIQNPQTLIVTGTYCIGKERIFVGIARKLGIKACISKDKARVLKCFGDSEIDSLTTTDVLSTNLHVLPMNKLNPSSLNEYLNRFNDRFSRLVAIKPTGWTYKGVSSDLEQIKPSVYGPVTIYGVPYSEHSSFSELRHFVEMLKPYRIIPTVNVGKPETRKVMESYLNAWKQK